MFDFVVKQSKLADYLCPEHEDGYLVARNRQEVTVKGYNFEEDYGRSNYFGRNVKLLTSTKTIFSNNNHTFTIDAAQSGAFSIVQCN